MIRLINIILITLIFFSCKQTVEQDKNIEIRDTLINAEVHSQNTFINKEGNALEINGIWVCYKYISADGNKKKYDSEYAQEIVKYSQFTIENNQLKLNKCIKNLYTYKYPTKLEKYEDESIFITYFKPKKDSAEFIGAINSGDDINCDIFDNYTFYISDNDNIIHYDRGYYFYYKKRNDINHSNNNYQIQGIPANNRNEWSVTGTFIHSDSLEDGYHKFRKEFPYGSKNTTETFPKNEEFFDNRNGIVYSRNNNEYKIVKDDPMGKIIIKISKNKNSSATLSYEMQYPEY